MKYHFADIENGQIKKGYTTLQIENHTVEVNPADTEAILLAEKNGGELALPKFSMELKEGRATGKKRVAIEGQYPGENLLTDEWGIS